MKASVLLLPLMILTAASPAAAQAVRTYACTLDGSNETWRYKFGPGELRAFESGAWSHNWCEPGATDCQFEGSRFSGYDPEGRTFSYDASTGRFSEDDIAYGKKSGACRPE